VVGERSPPTTPPITLNCVSPNGIELSVLCHSVKKEACYEKECDEFNDALSVDPIDYSRYSIVQLIQ
jgi:hypothetical protein